MRTGRLKHYLDDVCKLDVDTRRLIAREVLPEQVRTYDSLADLRLLHLDVGKGPSKGPLDPRG